MQNPSIMFVAGDPSGDQHASQILWRLKTLLPGVRCFGIGGPAMQSIGFDPLLPFEAFNRMGIVEVLAHLPFFLKAKNILIAAMDQQKPKVLVCVDYPGLNIPLMKEAHTRGIFVVWYIVPQVWAWKKKRAALLGNYATRIAAVFPFEVDFFKKYPAPITFVGHPLVEALDKRQISDLPQPSPGGLLGLTRPLHLSLVPGSREQEVLRILPHMVQAGMLLRQAYPNLRISVSKCRNFSESFFQKYCAGTGIAIVDGPLLDLLKNTDFALVTSGTATLETALVKVPLVVVYRTSLFTYSLMKNMIKVPFIGLPNIVAGEKIVPECIQNQANASSLARELKKFIESPQYYATTVEKLSRLKGLLGSKQPSIEVSETIASLISPS